MTGPIICILAVRFSSSVAAWSEKEKSRKISDEQDGEVPAVTPFAYPNRVI
tara:strand:- start:5316 stop:5468 length:153 start_codon:yes stop_codon:yes gene_type:complete